MKQITKMSRLTGELEKAFRLINEELFDNELPTPIITVIPTPRAYAHYVPYDIWSAKDGAKREINIASGTLDRPIENIIASLVHEMVHMYNDVILNVSDTSNKGVYHNKQFKKEAEAHGLIVTRSEKYGYSHTEPSDTIIDFILTHDELREIEMCRANPALVSIGIGTHTGNGGATVIGTATKSHHRKYICPCCSNSVRATKEVHIMCMDCIEPMQLA
ncbi:MAG: SprT-like family protein [Ruminococcus sp.]